jgi:hypothetical protein
MTPNNFVIITGSFYVLGCVLLLLSCICLRTENYEICGIIYGNSSKLTTWFMFCFSLILIIFLSIGVIFKYSKIAVSLFKFISLKKRHRVYFQEQEVLLTNIPVSLRMEY